MTKYNCIVAQSGGPTAAINSSLAGVINAAINSNQFETVYGSINGIQGVLNNKMINLNNTFERDYSAIETLKVTPAMYLGSCRYKLPTMDDGEDEYKQIFDTFDHMNIHAFFYIGGNDSMDTVDKLSQYAKKINYDISIIGIPKTIDNDLVHTDHTPGFGSAAKYVATSMLEIAHDTYIYDLESVTIVEIMGRNAGWLTAAAALARTHYSSAPDLIYLPEKPFDIDHFIEDIKTAQKTSKNVIIAVSEGIKNKDGQYISATNAIADEFGHAQLSGTAKCLEHIVKERLGCKVRSIELNVLQRSAMHSSSLTDLDEAFRLGEAAVTAAQKHCSSIMLTLNRTSSHPYTIEIGQVPVSEVANAEKAIPLDWINEEGNDVNAEIIEYLKPLIVGEPKINYYAGIPAYLDIRHLY